MHKADIDSLTYDVAEIKGDVKVIKQDLLQVEKITAKNWSDITDLKMVRA